MVTAVPHLRGLLHGALGRLGEIDLHPYICTVPRPSSSSVPVAWDLNVVQAVIGVDVKNHAKLCTITRRSLSSHAPI